MVFLTKRKNIYYYPSLDSTNLTARRLAKEGAPAYTVVLANEQLKGRGRAGRSWFSPPGKGLWFSIILRTKKLSAPQIAPLTLVSAAVLARHLRQSYNLEVMVKWPNDLLIGGRKIGGILTELSEAKDKTGQLVIIGIGLNVNHKKSDFPPALDGLATSLACATGHELDRNKLFKAIKRELFKSYRRFFRKGFAPFQELWIRYNDTLGKPVKVTWPNGSLEGEALGLSSNCALLVKDSNNVTHHVHCGEIHS